MTTHIDTGEWLKKRQPGVLTHPSDPNLLPPDPNLLLMDPKIQQHLQQLHLQALTREGSSIGEDEEDRGHELARLSAYNRRSEVGAFKIKLVETSSGCTYSGPIKFHYKGLNREVFCVLTLTDGDRVGEILPKLRYKFKVAADVTCRLRERIDGDEILLDPDDRPLELAVNSKSPVTFHLATERDRNEELLKNLRLEDFSSGQIHRQSVEKVNWKDREHKRLGSVTSSSSKHKRRGSKSETGSRNGRNLTPDPGKKSSTMSKLNGHSLLRRKTSLKESLFHSTTPSAASRAARSSSMPKHDRPVRLLNGNSSKSSVDEEKLSITSTEKSSSRTGRVRQVKQRKEVAGINRSRSRSASARKLFSTLRRYRTRSSSRGRNSRPSSDVEDSESVGENIELSSDATLPGILKIFGDALSPGANYKSVMATSNSTAIELVKIALGRYGIDKHDVSKHVMCEVVGRFCEDKKENGKEFRKGLKVKSKKHKSKSNPRDGNAHGKDFIEDYVRPLNDHEKPLTLQSYWKPQQGLLRRFEIRRRSQIFKQEKESFETREVNSQAKRLVLQKSRTNLVERRKRMESESDEEKITSFDASPLLDNGGLSDSNNFLTNMCTDVKIQNKTQNQGIDANTGDITGLDRVTPDGVANALSEELAKSSKPPSHPYLITLQGNEDNLIRALDKDETLLGSEVTDFKLTSSDVLPHHCVIKRRIETVVSKANSHRGIKRWCVTINPLTEEGEVKVNGVRVVNKHTLQHGELISVGKQHLFMFKDPSSHINLSDLINTSFNHSAKDSDISSTEAQGSTTSLNSVDLIPKKTPRWRGSVETVINYRVNNEDEILKEIFYCQIDFDHMHGHVPLLPAALLTHCILHSCFNFDLQLRNELLLKIASTLQTLVLNATRKVSIQEVQSCSSGESYLQLISSLRPILYWMSNSLEVFEFLQNHLSLFIKQRVKEERQKGVVDPNLLVSIEDFRVSDEILGLMEEVVMYAFQQLVYYLTKILYGCLPAVFESNPFTDEEYPSVNRVVEVFTRARELMTTFEVNDRVREQLFAYLFFFSNVSLFNTLMEESSDKYYKWGMGVRIRGNLEVIESWAEENGFSKQCSEHMEKISALANLLATPKTQFLKNTWTSFRENFPALSPPQLHKVLTDYRFPGSSSKPLQWQPSDEELVPALNTNCIVESYDQHPPLMLPAYGCRICLKSLPEHQSCWKIYEKLKEVGAWFSTVEGNVFTRPREQPDGRELTRPDIDTSSYLASSQRLTKTKGVEQTPLIVVKNSAEDLSDEEKRSSSTEKRISSLERKNYHGKLTEARDNSSSNETNSSFLDLSKHFPEKDDFESDSDELLVLPISETPAHLSTVSPNRGSPMSLSSVSSKSSKLSQDGVLTMPKEVFIVDIKKGFSGLVVGLIDGLATSLGVGGIYVRSLLPDDSQSKLTSSKHHDVIRCWLQEGRLQLGDRILAANGRSLISMNYPEAVSTIREAGDKVRLLVGRCGNEVAAKITSSTC